MTTDPTNYGVQRYAPSVPLYGSAISASATDPYEPETWTDITARCNSAGMKLDRNVRLLALRVTDLRTGWGQQDDKIKASVNTGTATFRRHLTLPPLVTQSALATAMNQGAMFSAHIPFGPGTATTGQVGLTGQDQALVMVGGNAGTSTYGAFTETTSISPVPLQFSAPHAGVLVSVSATTGRTEQVVFGYIGVAADFSGGAGAQGSGSYANVVGDTLTQNLWGALPTNLNATTPGVGGLLLYAGTGIYFLSNDAAASTAPTLTLGPLPGGGTNVGVDALQKNYLNRAHWLMPKQNSTTSVFSSDKLLPPNLDWISTNLEGTQPEILPTTLSRVRGGVLWNHQAIRWDGMRLTRFDGETEYDMKVMEGRELNSDFRWGISNVTVNGSELYVWIVRMDMTASAGTLGLNELHLEKYVADGVYLNYGPVISAAAQTAGSVSTSVNREYIYGAIDLMHQASCGIPVSRQTGFAHLNMYNSTKWDRVWIPPEGVNPFLHLNKTGASDEISQVFAPATTFTSSRFPIPGYSGIPAVAVGCSAAEMDVAAGGSDCFVNMSWNQQLATSHSQTGALTERFGGGDPTDQATRFWLDNRASFTQGQFVISINQGADTHKTPNALPATFYVMVCLDGIVRSPREAGFSADAGWAVTHS